MKKILFIFVMTISVYGSDELKIYERVLPSIFRVSKINVFISDDLRYNISKSKYFRVVNHCEDAMLLMGSGFKNLKKECLQKPVFATNYITYKKYKNSFGAFYWRKARPQLKFNLDVLGRLHLVLPRTLQKYAR